MKRDAGKEKFWREVVGEACSSGQTVREFCRQRQVKEPPSPCGLWRPRKPTCPPEPRRRRKGSGRAKGVVATQGRVTHAGGGCRQAIF